MGEARTPLFAYVDESGNTGRNIFDTAQPDYYTAALARSRLVNRSRGGAAAFGAHDEAVDHQVDLGMKLADILVREPRLRCSSSWASTVPSTPFAGP